MIFGPIVASVGYLIGWYLYPRSPARATLVCVALSLPALIVYTLLR